MSTILFTYTNASVHFNVWFFPFPLKRPDGDNYTVLYFCILSLTYIALISCQEWKKAAEHIMISLTPYQTLLWSLTDDSISNQYITKSSPHPPWSVYPEETTLLTRSEAVKLLNQTNMAQITHQPQHPLHRGPPSTAANTFHRRNQFISTYKTKKLKRTTAVDQALTAQSSHTESADCKLDAALYTQSRLGPRSDVEVYISLYGLEPRVVERIGESYLTPWFHSISAADYSTNEYRLRTDNHAPEPVRHGYRCWGIYPDIRISSAAYGLPECVWRVGVWGWVFGGWYLAYADGAYAAFVCFE